MDIEELKQLIIYNLDVVDFLDIVQLDLADLVEQFTDEILLNFDALVVAVQ